MSEAVEYERIGDIAVLAANNPPVNALGVDVRRGLLAGIERAEAERAKAVLIYGKGRTYFAGADIREFGKPPQEPWLPGLCDRIEASPLLVVSALHGTALGGGLEVALSSHYRIAVPSAFGPQTGAAGERVVHEDGVATQFTREQEVSRLAVDGRQHPVRLVQYAWPRA